MGNIFHFSLIFKMQKLLFVMEMIVSSSVSKKCFKYTSDNPLASK